MDKIPSYVWVILLTVILVIALDKLGGFLIGVTKFGLIAFLTSYIVYKVINYIK